MRDCLLVAIQMQYGLYNAVVVKGFRALGIFGLGDLGNIWYLIAMIGIMFSLTTKH